MQRRHGVRKGFMHLRGVRQWAARGLPSVPLPTLVEGIGLALADATSGLETLVVSALRLD